MVLLLCSCKAIGAYIRLQQQRVQNLGTKRDFQHVLGMLTSAARTIYQGSINILQPCASCPVEPMQHSALAAGGKACHVVDLGFKFNRNDAHHDSSSCVRVAHYTHCDVGETDADNKEAKAAQLHLLAQAEEACSKAQAQAARGHVAAATLAVLASLQAGFASLHKLVETSARDKDSEVCISAMHIILLTCMYVIFTHNCSWQTHVCVVALLAQECLHVRQLDICTLECSVLFAADKGLARRAGKTGCKLAVVQLLRMPGEQSHGSDRQHSEPKHPHVGRTDSIQNLNPNLSADLSAVFPKF